MLSISIRYGGKLSYAMRALCPMLGSNSSQTETALSQMLGHDGASRHTLLSKMLRHNSTRAQNHSDISIGLRQRSCAAVCDMFPGKNHGSHFTTIKSIGKTHHPVPLRFAVNGSASARYASPSPKPAAPGRQWHPCPHLRLRLRLFMLRPLRRHSHQRRHPCPKLRSTASPRAHGTEGGKLAWTEQDNNHLSFACAAEGS